MKISENISLRDFNSFGVEVRAARLVEWETAGELTELDFGERWMALGGGNNILFTQDYDGMLVKSAARKIEVADTTAGSGGVDFPSAGSGSADFPTSGSGGAGKVTVRAGAGVDWGEFVKWCVGHGLWGAENLSGIPGTVGACPIQNIGAYGAEAKDIIASVECFCIDSRTTTILAAEHCAFGYRDSIFKRSLRGRVIVTAVDFSLSREPRPNLHYATLAGKVAELGEPTLENIGRAVIGIRDGKLPDPRKTGNAGSFFKNPVVDTAVARKIAEEYPGMPLYPCAEPGKTKLAAGWLIERAGWKGRTEGRVGIHPEQALIIVNLGGATGREIVDFSRRVQAGVGAKFGVELESEVNIV